MRLAILLIIIAVFGTSSVFAQSSINIESDKPTYERGESIILVGKVQPIIGSTPILIKLLDQNGGLLQVWQETLARDGSFTVLFQQSDSWDISMPLNIQASYGSSKTTMQFKIVEEKAIRVVTGIEEVQAGSSGTFDLDYTINGGTITDTKVLYDELSLEINIDAKTDGVLRISIPNSVMVSQDHTDRVIPYIVLVDGFQVDIEEASEIDTVRTLIIPFAEESQRIQIIGTYIIPEFGSISIMVLLISIIASIIVVNRTKII